MRWMIITGIGSKLAEQSRARQRVPEIESKGPLESSTVGVLFQSNILVLSERGARRRAIQIEAGGPEESVVSPGAERRLLSPWT